MTEQARWWDLVYAIEVENLTKRYNSLVALDGVSFKVKRGDIVGYLGPNGAGKTTTIKVLANLLRPTSGAAYILGTDVAREPKRALRHVGCLIEVPGFYDFLTPQELLTYIGEVHGMRQSLDERIGEVLDQTKISAWRYKKIGSFSTGMLRRLSIAAAIFHDPDILILDEPVIGLDPEGIMEVRQLIRSLGEKGMTIFLSSHLLEEVAEVCKTVLFLNRGRLVAEESVPSISRRMKSRAVRVSFLGEPREEEVAKIRGIPDVRELEVRGEEATIAFDGDPKSAAAILESLVKAGIKITSYVPETMGLEDFYFDVMRREEEGQ